MFSSAKNLHGVPIESTCAKYNPLEDSRSPHNDSMFVPGGGASSEAANAESFEIEGKMKSELDEVLEHVVPFIIPEHRSTFNSLWPTSGDKGAILCSIMCVDQNIVMPLYECILRKLNRAAEQLEMYCSPILNNPNEEEAIDVHNPPEKQQMTQKAALTETKNPTEPSDGHTMPSNCTPNAPNQQVSQGEGKGLTRPYCDSPVVVQTKFNGFQGQASANAAEPVQSMNSVPDDDGIVFFDKVPDISACFPSFKNKKAPEHAKKTKRRAVPPVVKPLSDIPLNSPRMQVSKLPTHSLTNEFGFRWEFCGKGSRKRFNLPIVVCRTLEEVAEHMFNRKEALSAYDNELDNQTSRRAKIESQPVDEVIYHVDISSVTFKDGNGVERPCTEPYHLKQTLEKLVDLVQEVYYLQLRKTGQKIVYGRATCQAQENRYKMKAAGYHTSKLVHLLACNCKGSLSFQVSSIEKKLAIRAIHRHHKFTRTQEHTEFV